jgi:biofilm protein TabA
VAEDFPEEAGVFPAAARQDPGEDAMILDTLDNADRYTSLHPAFAKVFAFLRSPSFHAVDPGRLEIDGTHVYALVSHLPGKRPDEARLEAHRRYIDVQYLIAGTESMGWRALADCGEEEHPYDPEKDLLFLSDPPATWITIHPGTFVVFFPGDAHAPMVSHGIVRKVVLKVEL